MDTRLSFITLAFVGGAVTWLGFRLGVAMRIPLFLRWKERLDRREKFRHQRCSIRFDSEAITISDLRKPDHEPIRLAWNEIDHLTVFKVDLFTVDLICLHVGRDGAWAIHLDEDMDGWKEFVGAFPTHLQGCQPLEKWFSKVTLQTFAENPTEIYRRESMAGGTSVEHFTSR